MNLPYEGLEEIKILKLEAGDANGHNFVAKLNLLLEEGWTLLDISTMAPNVVTNPSTMSSTVNYFTYHFGKFKANKKEML